MADPQDPKRAPVQYVYGFDEGWIDVILHEPSSYRRIPEAFVQDLWHTQRFAHVDLQTSDRKPLTILDAGEQNTDTGPDFLNAHVRIGSMEWHGDVEVHVCSGGWYDHGHDRDARYNRVILHVTLYPDVWTGTLRRADATRIPELVLNDYLQAPLRTLVHRFYLEADDTLPCAAGWPHVPPDLIETWIATCATARIREKRDRLAGAYLQQPDLEILLYERLFAGLGYAKNAAPMTHLARRVPLSLARTLTDPMDLEGMYLGTAGLLPTPGDLLETDRETADYVMALRERFDRLRFQHDLDAMSPSQWKFFRLRPANFPPLRIAQAAALLLPGRLLHHDPIGTLVHDLRDERPLEALRAQLAVTPGPFWETHVRLEKATKPRSPTLGVARRDALIINAVLPVLLLYADQEEDPHLEEELLDVLQALPPEKNSIVRRFTELGTSASSALETQGFYHLYGTYCSEARCLSCAIGQFLLDRT